MSSKKTAIKLALLEVKKNHSGKLRAEDVVEDATPREHPLHNQFTWDDGAAAHQHRLWQARQLISVSITVVEGKRLPTFVSITSDRHNGGGYHTMVEVLNDDGLKAQLLEDAKKEMRSFTSKYRVLKQLIEVIEAMGKVLNVDPPPSADPPDAAAGVSTA